MKKKELELTRRNVTPAAFLAYVRSMIRKHGISAVDPIDIDLEYFAAGNDINFDVSGRRNPNAACQHERSISKPYEMQTYCLNWDGSCFNQIMEFTFDDENTGHGYFYLLNTVYTETETEAAAAAAEANKKAAAARALNQVSGMIDAETETAEIIADGQESIIIVTDKVSGNVTRGYSSGREIYFVKYDYTAGKWVNVIGTPAAIAYGINACCFDHDNWIQYGAECPADTVTVTVEAEAEAADTVEAEAADTGDTVTKLKQVLDAGHSVSGDAVADADIMEALLTAGYAFDRYESMPDENTVYWVVSPKSK